MNDQNNKLVNFFETEVKEAIPKLVREFANLSGFDSEEEADYLAECQLLRINTQNENEIEFVLMSEPSIIVRIGTQYVVSVEDQLTERLFFRTSDINEFIKYWNTYIVDYYGQNVHFPEIRL